MERKIVIVDDDRDFAQSIADALDLRGYSSIQASNYRDAGIAVAGHVPQIALIDIRLGAESGVGLVPKLKAQSPNILCVMMTAYAALDSAIDALQKGAYDYLRKPVNMEELFSVLERCYQKLELEEQNRAAEAALAERNVELESVTERFAGIVDLAGEAIVSIDENETIVLFNDAAQSIFGFEEDEAIGKPLNMLIPERYRSGHSGHINKFEHEETTSRAMVARGELAGLRKSGEEFPAEASISKLEIDGQKTFTVILRDISERRNAEEKLRESEKSYRTLIETMNESVGMLDSQGRVIYANDQLCELTGYNQQELDHFPALDLIAESDRDGFARRLGDRSSGAASRYEVNLVRKDGGHCRVFVSPKPKMSMDGEFEGSFAVITDITEQVETAKKLEESEEQLRQSQKMEAIGRLAGGVAHDFNNLLTAITGYSRLILDDLKPSDPLYHDVEEIANAGDRAAALTRQLLAFSRRQVLQPKVLDLNSIVGNMEKMLRRLIGTHIDLNTPSEPGLRRVVADPGQIEQVIMNLVINARDAMPQGGEIEIRTENVNLNEQDAAAAGGLIAGAHAMLTVTDTGTGMDEKTRKKIFEPFFTTKPKDKGTGLGLATVFGIVSQSGGAITVESQPNEGATFRIYLPEAEAPAEEEVATAGLDSPESGGETVLVVEDEDVVRGLIVRTLESKGYKTLQAEHGGDALLLCERHKGGIELMITDIVMPRMSGLELAERLKPIRPDMEVLFVSGYSDEIIADHGIADGGIHFVQKPFASRVLLKKIREILDARPSPPDLSGGGDAG